MRNLNFTEGQPISLVSLFSGIAELRTAIAKLHGFDAISPEQIIVGTGSKELIFLAMNIFHGGKYKKVTEIQILRLHFQTSFWFLRDGQPMLHKYDWPNKDVLWSTLQWKLNGKSHLKP